MNDYRYYNRNPDKVEIEDCVCRAISTATTLNYPATKKLLELSAEIYDCDTLCECCYRNLLEDILRYDRYSIDFGETVAVVARTHPADVLIIRIDGHLTCAIYGKISDIWDCSQELVDCFWIVK